MTVHTNCRHYRTSEPCAPHKETGVHCEECHVFEPVGGRILIVKLGAMGDVLRTTACLEPLKRRYPSSHITWLTRGASVPLLEGNALVDRVLSVDDNYLEFLLTERFDLAIGPDTDLLSAAITRLARADVKKGFVADGRGGVTPLSEAARQWWLMGIDDECKRANRRTYGEWLFDICDLPRPVSRPAFALKIDATDRIASRLQSARPTVKRWIGFNTGAGERWAEKRWKPLHYVRLAEIVAKADPECSIVLMGGAHQKELNDSLRRLHPAFVDGGTEDSVDDFAALIASCDWVLTPDSLGYHMACAVRTPAICVVGPTAPWELDTYDINCVVHAQLDCIACYRARCPFVSTCMDVLTPEVVWQRVGAWRSEIERERAGSAERGNRRFEARV